MKYPAKTNGTDGIPRYYGHIEPFNNPHGTCVTRTKVADGHEFFTNSPCRYNDDAGQEAQYFQLKQVVYAPERAVEFNAFGSPTRCFGRQVLFQTRQRCKASCYRGA